jgi:hypothetical protein
VTECHDVGDSFFVEPQEPPGVIGPNTLTPRSVYGGPRSCFRKIWNPTRIPEIFLESWFLEFQKCFWNFQRPLQHPLHTRCGAMATAQVFLCSRGTLRERRGINSGTPKRLWWSVELVLALPKNSRNISGNQISGIPEIFLEFQKTLPQPNPQTTSMTGDLWSPRSLRGRLEKL